MYKQKSVLALIPARGGSKGVYRKNIKDLHGKPLIAWTIELALSCEFVDKVVVSTDDQEIAAISRQYGAEVPFMRPKELATDASKGIDVVLHALNWLKKHDQTFDLVLLLQPTSPLRNIEDVTKSFAIYFEKKARAVVSVCEAEHSPLWMNVIGEDLCMKDFLNNDIINKNRQDLSQFYRLNGAVYISDEAYLRKHNGFFGEKTFACIMPKERSIDIDSEMDFKIAEFLISKSLFA